MGMPFRPFSRVSTASRLCGISGILSLRAETVAGLPRKLAVMSGSIAHRGPDGAGDWTSPDQRVGFVHRRLAIIDLSASGAQPMEAPNGTVITYNGEIYNYHRTAQRIVGALGVPLDVGYRGHPCSLRQMGRGLRIASARDVRVRSVGRARAKTVRGTRSVRHQAVLLYPTGRDAVFRLGSQGAAAVPARNRDRLRRRSRNISRFSTPSAQGRCSRELTPCCRATRSSFRTARSRSEGIGTFNTKSTSITVPGFSSRASRSY